MGETASRCAFTAGGTPERPGRAALSALLLLALLASGLGGCGGRPEGVVELDLFGPVPDRGSSGLGQSEGPSMRLLLQLVHEASNDRRVSAVLARFGPLEAGPARSEELRDALVRLRESGRTVHCHLEEGTNLSYWLAASACERISLSPGGSVDLTGLAAEALYIRELLERIGLEADVLHMGSHKDAADFLTREDMSEGTRETLEELLDSLTAMLVDGIAEGRRLEPAAARDLLGAGPYTAEEALERGLVDALAYRDEALEALRDALPGEPEVLEDWVKEHAPREGLLRSLAGGSEAGRGRGPRVGVLYLSGTIVRGGTGSLLGDQISLVRVRRALEQIEDDPEIRAVVVRIDSPGGSALASDEIWHQVLQIRSSRPVVASMGDVAASGGYYIAAAASEIVAGRGTLTGSIGVVGGKIVAGELMERVGVRPAIVRRGENAGLESLSRPFTPGQRAALGRQMEATYERFVECIVRGRAMDPDRVRRLATGRVWTGERALELGLVDRLGTLHDAIALARELGGLPEDAPVQAMPGELGLLERLEGTPALPAALAGGLPFGRRAARALPQLEPALETALMLGDEQVLALWPARISVR